MVLDILGVVVTLLAVAVGAWFLGNYLGRYSIVSGSS
jgi:hypothetical protein